MATFLFNTIQEFQAFVGGGANTSVSLKSIGPTMEMAAHNHLLPWISKAQWDKLVTEFEADNLSAEEAALIPHVQRPLAMLTLYEYSKIGGIQLSQAGFFRVEEDNRKSAFKYQENAYRDYYLNNGFEAIEMMLDFLEQNEANYPLWQTSASYNRNKALFINSAALLRDFYSKHISRYIFEVIRPILEQVEIFAILDMIGQAQFDELKSNIQSKTLTAQETALLPYIQKPIAHFAMREAIERHLVKFDGEKVVQQESLEPQSYQKAGPASSMAVNATTRHQDDFGNRLLKRLENYLTLNIDDFPLYQAHIDALAAAEEEEEQIQTICKPKRTGIIRF